MLTGGVTPFNRMSDPKAAKLVWLARPNDPPQLACGLEYVRELQRSQGDFIRRYHRLIRPMRLRKAILGRVLSGGRSIMVSMELTARASRLLNVIVEDPIGNPTIFLHVATGRFDTTLLDFTAMGDHIWVRYPVAPYVRTGEEVIRGEARIDHEWSSRESFAATADRWLTDNSYPDPVV